MVCGGYGPCHGQFSAGVHLACQQVGDAVTTLHTRLPCADDGIRVVSPGCRLDDGTAVEDDNDRLAGSVESVAGVENELVLIGCETELRGNVAVNTFTGLTGDSNDGGICRLCLIVDADGVNADFRIFLLSHHFALEPLGGVTLGLELHFGELHVLAVDVSQGSR